MKVEYGKLPVNNIQFFPFVGLDTIGRQIAIGWIRWYILIKY